MGAPAANRFVSAQTDRVMPAECRRSDGLMIFLFEITATLCFGLVLVKTFRRRNYPVLAVILTALLTITTGEIINAYVTRVTVYNSAFLAWFPGKRIPLAIVLAGVILTVLIYALTVAITRRIFPFFFGEEPCLSASLNRALSCPKPPPPDSRRHECFGRFSLSS